MSDVEKKDINSAGNGGNTPRRIFLKKSAAGAVITALPATSAWGACSVSGAMSGNLSSFSRHECEVPLIVGGRSPDAWKNIGKKCHAIFLNSGAKGSPRNKCYRNYVNEFIDTTSMDLNSLFTGPSDNLRAALESNGGGDGSLEFNLAGVYLNSYFGLYNIDNANNHAVASALVNSIILYLVTEANQGRAATFNFNFDVSNTSTSYELLECSALITAKP
jgi:hypothetical protein